VNTTVVSKPWFDELSYQLHDLRFWLTDPEHIDDALEELAEVLVDKHHDYGEENLTTFGELGVLVRATDKVARLKNLLEKDSLVDESREDTWRDLAGYAIQALIMLRAQNKTEEVDLFEIRKNRLIRGHCPDCGEGVLLRLNYWDNELVCSNRCGFVTENLYELHRDYPEHIGLIHYIASQKAKYEQK
jgi:hypothetical protein